MKKNYVMTDNQKKYAEEHHKLVYKYLRFKKLDVDTYYDIVIPGYLQSVVTYDERKDIQQYSFTTIAWNSMNTNLWNYYRYLNTQKRKADVLSLNYDLSDGNSFSLLDTLPSKESPTQDLEDKQLWLEVYSLLNENQRKLIQMRLSGYSRQAISRRLKIPFYEIDTALLNIWNCIKGVFSNETSIIGIDNELEMKGA